MANLTLPLTTPCPGPGSCIGRVVQKNDGMVDPTRLDLQHMNPIYIMEALTWSAYLKVGVHLRRSGVCSPYLRSPRIAASLMIQSVDRLTSCASDIAT